MARKCPECKVDVIEAQVSLRVASTGSKEDMDDWNPWPVRAGICPKCGWVNLHVAKRKRLIEWLDADKAMRQART
jgi:hypothetical protein